MTSNNLFLVTYNKSTTVYPIIGSLKDYIRDPKVEKKLILAASYWRALLLAKTSFKISIIVPIFLDACV